MVTADEAAALAKIGLDKSLTHDPAVVTDVTWKSTLPGQTAYSFDTAAASYAVATIDSTNAFSIFHADTNSVAKKWLVFGVGAGSSLVGPSATMLEAPVHYGADALQNPKDYYQRYAVCFEVDSTDPTSIVARYVGAAAIEGDGLTATDANVKEYWKN